MVRFIKTLVLSMLLPVSAQAAVVVYQKHTAQLILMYGEVLKTFVVDAKNRPERDASRERVNYHIKLMPEAIGLKNSKIEGIAAGIYICSVGYIGIEPFYYCAMNDARAKE